MERARFLGIAVGPLTERRLLNFCANRRGYWSLWIFMLLFVASLGAELVANDKPLLVYYDGTLYLPMLTLGSVTKAQEETLSTQLTIPVSTIREYLAQKI